METEPTGKTENNGHFESYTPYQLNRTFTLDRVTQRYWTLQGHFNEGEIVGILRKVEDENRYRVEGRTTSTALFLGMRKVIYSLYMDLVYEGKRDVAQRILDHHRLNSAPKPNPQA
jgi:hypothetical protein